MRLATYQPKILNEENYSTWTKLFRDYLGYVPIWCIPAETPEQFINSKQNTPSIIPAWVGMNASTNH